MSLISFNIFSWILGIITTFIFKKSKVLKSSNQESTPKICILGAGFAGLTIAIQLRRILNWNTFEIFEKNARIGGAWVQNTYPGAECDFPSHYYSWSFEPKADWTRSYAPQQEILDYVETVAAKYNIYEHLKLNTQVESVTWNDTSRKWIVVSKGPDGTVDTQNFDYVFSGVNFLWQPNKPTEFESFTGPCFHSAEWDHSVDLENKIVGVIGTGSSAVQIIPAIAPKVQKLHSFQRDPSWVLPKPTREYSAFIKWVFGNVPFVMKIYRWRLFWEIDQYFKAFTHGSKLNRDCKINLQGGGTSCNSPIQRKLVGNWGVTLIRDQSRGNPKLWKQILPENEFGCKVLSLSNTYIPTLASEKVEVHRGNILRVESNTIITENGEQTKLDALILATGFKSTEYFGPMEISGRANQNILRNWQTDRPRNFHAICSTLTPNFFFIGGPYGTLATATAIYTFELQANYAVKILEEMYTHGKNFIVIKKSAEDECMKEVDEAFKTFSFGNCGSESWLTNSKGCMTALAPFSAVEYWRRIRKVDFSKFEIM